MKADERRLVLHDVHGLGEQFMLLDGVDQDGKLWVYHRLEGKEACAFCGEQVTTGWTSFDKHTVVCTSHVNVTGKMG